MLMTHTLNRQPHLVSLVRALTRFALGAMLWIFLPASVLAVEAKNFVAEQTNEIVTELKENRERYQQDSEQLKHYLKSKLTEVLHFRYMGQFVAARHWKKMDDDQKARYLAEFEDLFIHSYAQIFFDNIDNTTFNFVDERPGRKKNRFFVTMEAIQDDNETEVEFELAKTSSGYRIINVKAEGINLLINYRKSFGDIINSQGIDHLIKVLAEKNKAEN